MSCWWAVNTTSTYPAPGDWLYQHFYAERGDLIRVAIAWWSEADPPPSYPTLGDDALTSNFNLYVWDPDDNLLQSGYSASWDNNYEIVQFSAPQTGLYEIGAYKSPNGTTESDNQLGVAVLRIRRPAGCEWDFNGSGDIDVGDIMMVAAHWNTACGDPDYDATYDIEPEGGDCDIDVVDIMQVAAVWGTDCSP